MQSCCVCNLKSNGTSTYIHIPTRLQGISRAHFWNVYEPSVRFHCVKTCVLLVACILNPLQFSCFEACLSYPICIGSATLACNAGYSYVHVGALLHVCWPRLLAFKGNTTRHDKCCLSNLHYFLFFYSDSFLWIHCLCVLTARPTTTMVHYWCLVQQTGWSDSLVSGSEDTL